MSGGEAGGEARGDPGSDEANGATLAPNATLDAISDEPQGGHNYDCN